MLRKMYAMLDRKGKNRVKGRDWYDFVWFASNHPMLHLDHLRQRMIQSGDWPPEAPLDPESLRLRLDEAIERLDVDQARREVTPFVVNPDSLIVWSQAFFKDLAGRIQFPQSPNSQ